MFQIVLFYFTVFLFINRLFWSITANISSSTFVKTEPSFIEEQNSLLEETREIVPKPGGRLMQSVSNIMRSPFNVPRRQPFNCSAYIPTPFQMWTMCDGRIFHYNNWPEQDVSSCSLQPPASSGFSVSDNSAFVKYCSQSPRLENNSLRFGRSASSEEAAAVLASFGNPEQGTEAEQIVKLKNCFQ